MKKTTAKIIQSAKNLRTYPSTAKKPVMVGHHRVEGTVIGAARKTAANLLRQQSKKDRRKIYLGE